MLKRGRKVRSDKKVDVKPTLPIDIKLAIYDAAYLQNMPVKDLSESICINAMKSEPIIDYLAKHFRRGYVFRSTMKIGRPERTKLDVFYEGHCEKITIKFHQKDYDEIARLAHALDITATSTCSLLLQIAYRNNLLEELSK